MNNKKKRELTNEEIDENIFEMCNICSTTDCTGLIQVVPRTEAELESVSYTHLRHDSVLLPECQPLTF